MTVRVLDLSHHQARRNADGSYTVVADLAQAKAAGAAGAIVRSNYGLAPDATAPEHCRRVDAAGLPRAFYWYPLSRQDPERQAILAYAQAGSRLGMRGYIDLEENAAADGAEPCFERYSDDYWRHVTDGLGVCDSLSGVTTGIYSSRSWMDYWFTAEQQRLWSARPGWWAHWLAHPQAPSKGIPWVPAGWVDRSPPWMMWQDIVGPWPGLAGSVDQSQVWPGVDLGWIFGKPVGAQAEATRAQSLLNELAGLI